MQQSRRDFVLGVGSLAAASVLPAIAGPKESDIKFGYAAITRDGNDTQAIRVPDSSRTPKESAIISKKYLEEKFGMKV